MLHIWVDADACPQAIKEILYRAAKRVQIPLIMVANQWLRLPSSPLIRQIRVTAGFDVADKRIVAEMLPGDLVITADIILADEVVSKKGIALNPRGELYTEENIKQRLAMRHLMEGLRDAGMVRGGPKKMSQRESMAFADQLDRLLARR